MKSEFFLSREDVKDIFKELVKTTIITWLPITILLLGYYWLC